MSKRCSVKNRRGNRCGAWAVTGKNKCALHLDPALAAKIGSRHRHSKHPSTLDPTDFSHRPLKSMGDVGELLEETIKRVRQGPFDLRAANAIGFLAGVLLKTEVQVPSRLICSFMYPCSRGHRSRGMVAISSTTGTHKELFGQLIGPRSDPNWSILLATDPCRM